MVLQFSKSSWNSINEQSGSNTGGSTADKEIWFCRILLTNEFQQKYFWVNGKYDKNTANQEVWFWRINPILEDFSKVLQNHGYCRIPQNTLSYRIHENWCADCWYCMFAVILPNGFWQLGWISVSHLHEIELSH